MKSVRYIRWLLLFAIVLLSAGMACTAPSALEEAAATLPPFQLPVPTGTQPPLSTAVLPAISSPQCTSSDCAKACVSQLRAVPESTGPSEARPKAAGQRPSGVLAEPLVTYPVNGNELGTPQYSQHIPPDLSALAHDRASQEKIWDYFTTIVPADRRAEIGFYLIATDGRGGMLASVEQFAGQSDLWGLVVDPADAARPRDLTLTLLHEFGHLLTLNSTQVQPDQAVLQNPDNLRIYAREAASCQQYFASGGCSLPDSYINQFFGRFWTKIYSEWAAVNAARKNSNYMALLARFYTNHPTQFITPYASTSPEEDMAETWAYFVLNPKPAEDSIAHRKVLFFYNYPELVDLRKHIVSGICSYAAAQ